MAKASPKKIEKPEDLIFPLIDRFPSIDASRLSHDDLREKIDVLSVKVSVKLLTEEFLDDLRSGWEEERAEMDEELGPVGVKRSGTLLDEDDYRDDLMIDELTGEQDQSEVKEKKTEEEDEFGDGFQKGDPEEIV